MGYNADAEEFGRVRRSRVESSTPSRDEKKERKGIDERGRGQRNCTRGACCCISCGSDVDLVDIRNRG